MQDRVRPLAVVTGASSGIGFELARQCAQNGFDVIVVSDGPDIETAANQLRTDGVEITPCQADLSTPEGVDELHRFVRQVGRPVDVLMANAGRGLGEGFLDQDFNEILDVIQTNVTGTTYLLHTFLKDMRALNAGRVLITGSIAGYMPGAYQAVYNGTKSYINSLSFALQNELKETDITVTCLMPGPTDTDFFDTAHMEDTKVGSSDKADPAKVAKIGFEAMMRGDDHEVAGFGNKLQAMMARFCPQRMGAEMHRKMAEPGTAKD